MEPTIQSSLSATRVPDSRHTCTKRAEFARDDRGEGGDQPAQQARLTCECNAGGSDEPWVQKFEGICWTPVPLLHSTGAYVEDPDHVAGTYCSCSAGPRGGVRRCHSSCENRAIGLQCSPYTCSLNRDGGRCGNDRFYEMATSCLYHMGETFSKCVFIAETLHRGKGLFAKRAFRKNDFVGFYAGEIINRGEMTRRHGDTQGIRYVMEYGAEFIDATVVGNHTRFINHDCRPNCGFHKCWFDPSVLTLCCMYNYLWDMCEDRGLSVPEWDQVGEDWKPVMLVCVITDRDVAENEELTVSYGRGYFGEQCLCNTCLASRKETGV